MTRVKRGVTARRRHKKVLAQTAGHRGGRHRLFRQANESLLHALAYAYRDRRNRKRDFRRLWILRINAAARLHGTTYSRLIAALNRANIRLDRKMLAELAVSDPTAFAAVVKTALASA
ncbi:MAG: 50S ribosomal protein L20 [Chloroflexi bacterium]|jgi:large subunit ribosomal protein L20|nr:50S ribosomal protein L20 [Chloroflexota bacterium]GIW09205.1 MAG: 50S ribosomal protein L20 [Dehalococcoidia bacterium]